MSKVTRKQAEKVLEALHNKYPSSLGNAVIHDAEHEEMPEGTWSIAWEGGDEDWDQFFSEEWNGQNSKIFVEPRNHWSVGIYPGFGA